MLGWVFHEEVNVWVVIVWVACGWGRGKGAVKMMMKSWSLYS